MRATDTKGIDLFRHNHTTIYISGGEAYWKIEDFRHAARLEGFCVSLAAPGELAGFVPQNVSILAPSYLGVASDEDGTDAIQEFFTRWQRIARVAKASQPDWIIFLPRSLPFQCRRQQSISTRRAKNRLTATPTRHRPSLMCTTLEKTNRTNAAMNVAVLQKQLPCIRWAPSDRSRRWQPNSPNCYRQPEFHRRGGCGQRTAHKLCSDGRYARNNASVNTFPTARHDDSVDRLSSDANFLALVSG